MKKKSVKSVLTMCAALMAALTLMLGNVTSVAASSEILESSVSTEIETSESTSELESNEVTAPDPVINVVTETDPEVLDKLSQIYDVLLNLNNLVFRLCELGDIMFAVLVVVLLVYIYYSYLAKFTKF